MSEVKQGVAAKLENVFLDILRFVILLVLAVSLVAAAVLGIYGVRDLGASEGTYQPEKVDNKALIQELKKSLESKPAATPLSLKHNSRFPTSLPASYVWRGHGV